MTHDRQSPPLPRWLIWTLTGAGVAALAACCVAGQFTDLIWTALT
ncbi:MAG TPA: hypothetical protein VIR33_02490 [Thermopolyspora sp.]